MNGWSQKTSVPTSTAPPFIFVIATTKDAGNRTPSFASVSVIHFESTGNGTSDLGNVADFDAQFFDAADECVEYIVSKFAVDEMVANQKSV